MPVQRWLEHMVRSWRDRDIRVPRVNRNNIRYDLYCSHPSCHRNIWTMREHELSQFASEMDWRWTPTGWLCPTHWMSARIEELRADDTGWSPVNPHTSMFDTDANDARARMLARATGLFMDEYTLDGRLKNPNEDEDENPLFHDGRKERLGDGRILFIGSPT